MNLAIFKDKKLSFGIISSFTASFITLLLAVTNNEHWLISFLVWLMLLAFSVHRADQLYKIESDK